MVATGEVYLVAQDANIYTKPYTPDRDNPDVAWIGPHNVWYDYEFATLQRNPAVTKIYTVNALTFEIDRSDSASWLRGHPSAEDAESHIDANTITPKSLQDQKDEFIKPKSKPENTRPDQCADPSTSNQNQKRAGKMSSISGKGTAAGTAKASGGACTPKSKAIASTSGKATGTAKSNATSAQQSSGAAKETGKLATQSSSNSQRLASKTSATRKPVTQASSKPTTLATLASTTKKPASTEGKTTAKTTQASKTSSAPKESKSPTEPVTV
jgi:hypothetical protein